VWRKSFGRGPGGERYQKDSLTGNVSQVDLRRRRGSGYIPAAV